MRRDEDRVETILITVMIVLAFWTLAIRAVDLAHRYAEREVRAAVAVAVQGAERQRDQARLEAQAAEGRAKGLEEDLRVAERDLDIARSALAGVRRDLVDCQEYSMPTEFTCTWSVAVPPDGAIVKSPFLRGDR